jgi:hypothetical protein
MEKRISKKFLVIGIIFLFLGASGMATAKESKTTNGSMIAPMDRSWSDNFDSYTAGSALHGQGGWAGWDNNAAATGYVSNAQSRSAPNSYESKWFLTDTAADMVQQFSGYDTGKWIFAAYQYVPSDEVGQQYFILMNTYTAGGTHNQPDWSLQLVFSADTGTIYDYNDAAATTTLITNAWIQIRVEIDLEADIQTVFYDNVQLQSKSWTGGVVPGGAKNIACVDLYSGDAATTSVYYDDISLVPQGSALTCEAGGPYTGKVNQPVQFTGLATGGTTPYSWAWTFGDGGTATTQNPTHTYTTVGTYNVTLTVTDAASLTATDTAVATITAPAPEIVIGNITGGFGIKAVIKNIGDVNATGVSWKIQLTGGLILLGKSKIGTVDIKIGKSATVKDPLVFGIGKTTITVTAGTASKTATAKVILFFVTGVA